MTIPKSETHALYRFLSADGELLYVGITSNPGRRWPEHEKSKPWWHEVTNIKCERHLNRDAALFAETEAIRNERPRYNIAQAVRSPSPESPGYRVQCGECEDEATVFAVLAVPLEAYRKHQERLEDPRVPFGEKIMTLPELLDAPDPASWHLTCTAHYAGDDVVSYWGQFKSSRRAAVDIIRHVGEKEWALRLTDFASFSVRLLAPAEAALPRGKAW